LIFGTSVGIATWCCTVLLFIVTGGIRWQRAALFLGTFILIQVAGNYGQRWRLKRDAVGTSQRELGRIDVMAMTVGL
jgi:hypothetical protein